tara:strand:+ start:277 stop:585 length:309 start_codon:yes stop_codon:yes gene_type:complete
MIKPAISFYIGVAFFINFPSLFLLRNLFTALFIIIPAISFYIGVGVCLAAALFLYMNFLAARFMTRPAISFYIGVAFLEKSFSVSRFLLINLFTALFIINVA